MHITVKNSDLSKELSLIEKIVGRKPTLSILSNVLIQAQAGAVLLKTTDLEIGLVGACAATVHVPGAVTLPAKKLTELVRAQSSPEITLQADARGNVKFSSGKFVSRLQTLPVIDFPAIPTTDGLQMMTLPRAALQTVINHTRFAISNKDQRFFMKGAYIAFPENELIMATTDGARLALSTQTREGAADEPMLLQDKAIDELAALLAEPGDSTLTFGRSDKHYYFDIDARLFVSRMIDGKFPTYDRIIPKSNAHVALIDRLEFQSMLRRLVLINDDVVVLKFTEDLLSCRAASADLGDGAEEISIEYRAPELELRYKGSYLLDFLGAATSPQITVALKDETTAAVFTDGAYMNVIIGMRT
jgi:DNA polymerase-3 subunit beta